MSERYRYGYGGEPPDHDRTFTRQGSMTEQRDEQAVETDAADEAPRGDAEDEERRADQIREAAAGHPQTTTAPYAATDPTDPRVGAAEAERAPAADADETDRPSTTSVFDVEEEATAADRDADEEARAADRDAEERPPIALGPPERGDETAGTAKPEAASPASGTPTDQTPAAVSTGVEAPEPDQAGESPPGTGTETLIPGSGPAPVAAPVGRGALLGSMDAAAVRTRFLDIQAGFVDEPRQAVQEAERFVDEMVQDLVKALANERAKLKGTIEQGSTEDLRVALRGYRAFVDRLLNLTM